MRMLFVGDCPNQALLLYSALADFGNNVDPYDCLFILGQYPIEFYELRNFPKVSITVPTFYFPAEEQENSPKTEVSIKSAYGLNNCGLMMCPDESVIAFAAETPTDLEFGNEAQYERISQKLVSQLVVKYGYRKQVDVLITNYPPCGNWLDRDNDLTRFSIGSKLASRLAYELRPRFHITRSNNALRTIPYLNQIIDGESHFNYTRLIALPPLNAVDLVGMHELVLKPHDKENLASTKPPYRCFRCPFIDEDGQFTSDGAFESIASEDEFDNEDWEG
ncbi:hypothetical protein ACOME3_006124 [Neoechinorhynchus agilis]